MSPRYKYLNSAGEHVHTLDNRPLIGTSRVVSVLAKPLTWWASGLAVQAFGCPDPKVLTKIKNKKATKEEIGKHASDMDMALRMIKNMDTAQFMALIDKAYRAHATTLKSKAVEGTDLHAELESFVKNHMIHNGDVYGIIAQYPLQIHPFIEWSQENVKRFLWSEGHCYSEVNWLGGICDVGYEKHDGTFGIGDFKSAKDAYPEHYLQIAGYHLQIAENGIVDADGNHLYTLEKPVTEYMVVPFGAPVVKAKPYENCVGAKSAFLSALNLYNFLPRD